MTSEQLKHHVFVGVVEDNNDPKRLCRIKVRVFNVYDEIPVEDIPWATPWKDLGGESGGSPPKGKVVSVVFDEGNIYKPEYIRAEHFNINLEKKLKEISEDDYLSFSSLLFDHTTQIYKTNSEGLKLDHEHTNINLDADGNINLNLRDNNSNVHIGSPDSDQSAILGDHFLNWMDTFIDAFLTGAHLGNLGAPNPPMPTFINVCTQYKVLRNPKFLSHRVKIVDNFQVETQKRIYEEQFGDQWQNNKKENDLTNKENNGYKPVDNEEKATPPAPEGKKNNENSNKKDKKDKGNKKDPKNTGGKVNGTNNDAYEEKAQTVSSPGVKNGKVPADKLVDSKHLSKQLGGGHQKLRADAAKYFDLMMDAFYDAKFPGKADSISFADGYRPLANQVKLIIKFGVAQCAPVFFTGKVERKMTKTDAQKLVTDGTLNKYVEDDKIRGTSNHGWGLAVDMHWGAGKTRMWKNKEHRESAYKHPNYRWFFGNSWQYGWYSINGLRDDTGTDEWWHWEFHGIDTATGKGKYGKPAGVGGPPPLVERYAKPITMADITTMRSYQGYFSDKQLKELGFKT